MFLRLFMLLNGFSSQDTTVLFNTHSGLLFSHLFIRTGYITFTIFFVFIPQKGFKLKLHLYERKKTPKRKFICGNTSGITCKKLQKIKEEGFEPDCVTTSSFNLWAGADSYSNRNGSKNYSRNTFVLLYWNAQETVALKAPKSLRFLPNKFWEFLLFHVIKADVNYLRGKKKKHPLYTWEGNCYRD